MYYEPKLETEMLADTAGQPADTAAYAAADAGQTLHVHTIHFSA